MVCRPTGLEMDRVNEATDIPRLQRLRTVQDRASEYAQLFLLALAVHQNDVPAVHGVFGH